MSISEGTSPYISKPAGYAADSYSTTTGGPLFSGADILGGIVGAAMLLLPLSAAGFHYSHQGWDTVQTTPNR